MKRRHLRARAVLAATVAAVPLAITAPMPAVAEAVPTASCYDTLSFDGLDSRYTSRHCSSATGSAGYSAQAYTNTSAQSQLQRQPTDAVYFFAGHALVDVDYFLDHAAVGLAHEYPAPKRNMDALVGDPSATPYLQGPVRVCDETGRDCRDILLTSYPWASQLEQHNLVVLQSCNTAGNNENFLGMAETAQLGGAGTVIGFRGLVYFPVTCPNCDSTGIRWSRVFWDNLRAGYTYTTATIRAANSLSGGYGYGTYRILTNPDSPQRLRPAQYYVWPGGGVDPTPQAPAGTTDEAAEAILSNWLGTAQADGLWQASSDPGRFESYRPGAGVFEVDKASGRVVEAVFERAITDGAVAVDRDAAVAVAQRFVTEHGDGHSGLDLRTAEFVDHGTFSEYRVTWQARTNGAWLPERITVGVNAASGEVIYYASDPTANTADLQRAVTAEQAEQAAMALLHGDGWQQRSRPTLEVVVDHDGTQRLVWVQEIIRKQTGIHIPEGVVIFTDARTGQAEITAQT